MSVPGEDLKSVMLDAKAAGKRTANISDVDLTDATPAAMGASVNDRNCQGPTDMGSCPAARKANGGKGSIAEQLVDNKIDVLLGGGRNRFTQNVDAGGTLLARSTGTLGYREVTNKQGLAGLTLAGRRAGARPVRVRLHDDEVRAARGHRRGQRVDDVPLLDQQPRRSADPGRDDVEGAASWWTTRTGSSCRSRARRPTRPRTTATSAARSARCREADKALEVLLEFQRTHPDTLIVVTADHGHATQIVRAGEAKAYGTLQTADGSPIRVGYSTSTSGQWHTGTQVPIAAKGPQAANILGTLDQTELYQVLKGLAPAGTDVEAPVTTATVAPAANANGWNTTVPVTITLSATDAIGCRLDRVPPQRRGVDARTAAPIQVAAAGTTSGRVPLHRQRRQRRDDPLARREDRLHRADRDGRAEPGRAGRRRDVQHAGPGDVDRRRRGRLGHRQGRVPLRDRRVEHVRRAVHGLHQRRARDRVPRRSTWPGTSGRAATVRFTTAGLSGTPASCAASSSDEFDGSAVDPKWSVLRPTASRYSVTGGKLQIRFDGTNSDLNGTTASATNQFLQPAPTGGPWTATTKLDMTDAKMQSNQVGFVLWQAEGSGANRFAKVVVNARTTDASAPSRPSWWVERQVTRHQLDERARQRQRRLHRRAPCRTPCSCAWPRAAARCRRSAPPTRSTGSRGRSS